MHQVGLGLHLFHKVVKSLAGDPDINPFPSPLCHSSQGEQKAGEPVRVYESSWERELQYSTR